MKPIKHTKGDRRFLAALLELTNEAYANGTSMGPALDLIWATRLQHQDYYRERWVKAKRRVAELEKHVNV